MLRQHAPCWTVNGTSQEVCLSYHLRGVCYDNCQRAATHIQPSRTQRATLGKLKEDHLQPGSTATVSTTGDTAAAPAAGGTSE